MRRCCDRVDAGRQLAQRLEHLRGEDVVVLGLPRGGVPVAFEVAEALRAPLDVIIARKLGLPFQPEPAMGAIGEGGFRVVDRDLVARARITAEAWHGSSVMSDASSTSELSGFGAVASAWICTARPR